MQGWPRPCVGSLGRGRGEPAHLHGLARAHTALPLGFGFTGDLAGALLSRSVLCLVRVRSLSAGLVEIERACCSCASSQLVWCRHLITAAGVLNRMLYLRGVLGAVPKKPLDEFRIIHYLSFPKGGSVNDSLFFFHQVCLSE